MASLEERIAALEQRLSAVPLAANPPITIGELNNVPAPGSPIASQWSQQVTQRIMHRYATMAARNAAPGSAKGSMAYTTEMGRPTYYGEDNIWHYFSPTYTFGSTAAGNVNPGGGIFTAGVTQIAPVSGLYMISYTAWITSVGYLKGRIFLQLGGTVLLVTPYTSASGAASGHAQCVGYLTKGQKVDVYLQNDEPTSIASTFNDPTNNQLFMFGPLDSPTSAYPAFEQQAGA